MALTPGKWHTVTCSLGHRHDVYIQKKTDECAIACAAMVINRNSGGRLKPELSELRQMSQQHKGGYRPSVKDAGAFRDQSSALGRHQQAKLFRPSPSLNTTSQSDKIVALQQKLVGSYGYVGTTTIDNLPQLLAAAPWSIHWAQGNTQADGKALRDEFKKVVTRNPFVLRIAWDGGGGHAVLLDAHKPHSFSKDQFCICDPGLGVVTVTFEADKDFKESGGISNLPYRPVYSEGGTPTKGHVRLSYVRVA